MHSCQAPYRELFDALHRHEGASTYADLLAPWVEAHEDERRWLRAFAARRGDPAPAARVEDLWRLYAFNRVIETLLLRFQRGAADGSDWPGPAISLAEVASFATSIGLSVSSEPAFSPFSHEIVSVEQASDDDQPILLRETLWPCLWLGDMIFSRAGARVSAGRRHARKDIAESSSMYWAFRRKNRPYRDLSQGWGGNSQWRTSFRRDYRADATLHYNVDGHRDVLSPSPSDIDDPEALTPAERIELLTHRCFVTSSRADDDLWPYDDKLTITL